VLSKASEHSDFSQAVTFFDQLLRRESLCRVADEYPLVFQEDFSSVSLISEASKPVLSEKKGQLWVMADGGQTQAGLVTLRRQIRVEEDIEIQLLFVGSVVTDQAFRHRGLQRELFKAVEQAAREAEIDFLLLWSNQLDFYKKLGFELGGLQATWSSPHKNPLLKSPSAVQFGFTRDIPMKDSWYRAFKRKPLTVERSLLEMQKLWQIPQMMVAATENAYALYKKGEDFDGMCHEWAGPCDEVLACFDRLRAFRSDVRFLSPGHLQDPDEMKVVRLLEMAGFESRLEYLGLFKVLSSRFVMQDLQPETLKLPFFIWGLDSI
jgi:GNAT superfamily N-acetyltransferase